jgi:hypothetical protein
MLIPAQRVSKYELRRMFSPKRELSSAFDENIKTIGMVRVAGFSAATTGVLWPTITSGAEFSSSAR